MVETIAVCPLCRSSESRPFDRREFRDIPVLNRVCDDCGLVFQSPRMTAAELDQFYASQYRQVYQGEQGPTAKDLFVQRCRAAALYEFAHSQIPNPHQMLDIGCSAGILLEHFRQQFGCVVVGIEPGDSYRDYAQNQGLKVYPSLEFLATLRKDRFDLISMAHVLEHLPNPVAYLAELRQRWLSSHGWLLIEVPNLYCHDSFEVAHLTSFSAHTLQQVLRRAGYEVIALRSHGLPRSEILPLYLTVLAQPRPVGFQTDPVVPESRVALKRRLGLLRRRILQRLQPGRAWLPMEGRD